MSQAGSYRLAVSKRYWRTAELVLDHQSRPFEHLEPVGYLLAMSTELALKAYLTDRGVPDSLQSSKKLGHDLGACLRKAMELGLEIGAAEGTCVLSLRSAHLTHFNRYGPKSTDGLLELGGFPLTDEMVALRCVAVLIDRVDGATDTLPLLKPLSLRELAELEALEQNRVDWVRSIGSQRKRK